MALDPNIPAAALMAGCMLAEWGVGRFRGKRLYRLADTLSDVGTALGQLVVQAMLGFTTLTLYAWMEAVLGMLDVPVTSVGAWIAAFFVAELVFYWRHRCGHLMHVFWAVHEVHHQSPEMNLAVAPRIGWLQWAQTAVFVVPLAVLGIPPLMFAALFAGIHFYNFLLHTQLVPRLGPLEWVLATPSHHRVHHGRNPRYLDRNFGFTLSIYDRLFGTYAAEVEPVAYGTLAPLPTWNPVDNNLRPFLRLAGKVARAGGPWRGIQVLVRHPAWDPATGRVELPDIDCPAGDRAVPADGGEAGARVAVVALVGVAVVASLWLVGNTDVWSAPTRIAVGMLVIALTATVGLLARPRRAP